MKNVIYLHKSASDYFTYALPIALSGGITGAMFGTADRIYRFPPISVIPEQYHPVYKKEFLKGVLRGGGIGLGIGTGIAGLASLAHYLYNKHND